jgi:hypothetical protein
MGMSVNCICGKQLNVKFEWIGKRIKCPGCGSTMTVPSDGITPTAAPATGPQVWAPRARPHTEEKGSRIHLSPFTIAWISAAILIPTIILIVQLGPKRVMKQWETIGPLADAAAHDVVTRALQSYLQQHAGYDPTDPRHPPGVSDLDLLWTDMHMTMPEWVGFVGHTNVDRQLFTGKYYTRTGEVVVDLTVMGKTLNVTGRIEGGNVVAEIDGKLAVLDLSKKHDPD